MPRKRSAASSTSATQTSAHAQAEKEDAVKRRRERRTELAAIRRSDVEMLKNEGNDYFKKGQYAEAVKKYEEAIILAGEKPHLLSNLAAAQLKLNQYPETIGSATTALLYDPHNIKARYRRAIARNKSGQYTRAITDFRILHELDPSDPDIRRELEALKQRVRNAGVDSDEDFGSEAEYPGLDEPPYEYYSDSDTSDCLHIGNGAPCKFYNKGMCKKGDQCQFSHAPDDMSIRDELGRNVCILYLINGCPKTERECVYCHSREFLPPGWWTSREESEICRQLATSWIGTPPPLETIALQLRAPELGIGFKRVNPYSDLGIRSLRVDRKERVRIRTAAREQATKKEKEKEVATTPAAQGSASSGPKKTGATPFVVVLSLEYKPHHDGILSHLMSSLRATLEVKWALSKDLALTYLQQPGLAAVYITDPGIIRQANTAVLRRLMTFVKDEGGRVCIGSMFPGDITAPDFDSFFRSWGLNWKYGSYHRTTFALNTAHPLASSNPSLLPSYSMKAQHVDNISNTPDIVLYRATDKSRLESLVYAPVKITKRDESPAVAARVGQGWLSFLGDVNGESESTRTVMAMLGVLDESKVPELVPPKSRTLTVTRDRNGELVFTESKASSETVVMSDFLRTHAPLILKDSKEDMTGKDPDSKFILILVPGLADKFEESHKTQIEALRERSPVEIASSRYYALLYLSRLNLGGVYVAEDLLHDPSNSDILDKVVAFAKKGGTVVVGGLVPTTVTPVKHISNLFKAFGVKWVAGQRREAEWRLDRCELRKENLSLPRTCSVKALTLKNVDKGAVVYLTLAGSSVSEYPVVRAKVGRGYIGYVGFEEPEEPMCANIILAMFNKLDYTSGPLKPTSKKFILVLSFDRVLDTEAAYSGLLSAFRRKAEVLHGLSNERVIDLLNSKDLLGVVIMTTDITNPPHEYLLKRLVQYTKNGGTTLVAGYFAGELSFLECKPFFENNWGLSWDIASGTSVEATLNKNSSFANNASANQLPERLPYFSAVLLSGVKESMVVYKDSYASGDELLAPVAVSPMGKGRLGWLGTTSNIDDDQQKVVLAMLGL